MNKKRVSLSKPHKICLASVLGVFIGVSSPLSFAMPSIPGLDPNGIYSQSRHVEMNEKRFQHWLKRRDKKMVRHATRCRPGFDEEDQTLSAVEVFRKYFHQGKYCKIPELKARLIGEYLQLLGAYRQAADINLKNQVVHTAKIIGLASLWKGAQSDLDPNKGPLTTNELVTAAFYMERAYQLDIEDGELDDPQILGFLAGAKMGLAQIHQDHNMVAEASQWMRQSIDAYPVFVLFGATIGASRAPYGSPTFDQAVNMIFDIQDICMQAQVDRDNPDHTPYLPIEGGDYWSCPNTDRSLHRYEAVMLYAGDILTKAGQLDAAAAMYNNATFSSTADRANWKFWTLLQHRLNADLESLRDQFRTPGNTDFIPNSKFQCSICHQD